MDLHFIIYTAKKVMKWISRIFMLVFTIPPITLFDKNFLFLKHLIYFFCTFAPHKLLNT